MNWDRISNVGPEMVLCLKHFVANAIAGHSPIDSHNIFERMRDIFGLITSRIDCLHDITLDTCHQIRNACRAAGREYHFHAFRSAYSWWADLDFPGSSFELAVELRSWSVPGNKKGEAVLSWDPQEGPLTDPEFLDLTSALAKFNGLDASVVMALVELGSNPRNLCFIEERDLFVFGSGKDTVYQVDVLRTKKRLDYRAVKRRRISTRLGQALQCLIAENEHEYGGPDPKRPIFISFGLDGDDEVSPISRFKNHQTNRGIWQLTRAFAKRAQLKGRDGKPLNLHPRRLRYTFATRAAEAGVPPVVLAEMLDHTDLQHVMVYYKASPKLSDRVQQSLAESIGHIWKRFLGEVVEKPNPLLETIFGSTANKMDIGGIGSCGSKSACHLSVPYACYVCPHFQAWKDAPHQKLLDGLIAEQEKAIALGHNNQANRIPRQNQRVIDAVKELIDQLKEGVS